MNRKIILLIGDSLLMPRPNKNITYKDTYGYLIKKYFENKKYFVIIIAKRGNNSLRQSLEDEILYGIKQFEPTIAIIHLGIVDCAPRIFTKIEKGILTTLPPMLNSKIINFFSKRRLFFTKYFPKKYVNSVNFKRNIQKFFNTFNELNVIPILINIIEPPEKLCARSYNFLKNVKTYNNILLDLSKKNNCKLLDFNKIVKSKPDYLIDDGIHLSKLGNSELAKEIINCINQINKER